MNKTYTITFTADEIRNILGTTNDEEVNEIALALIDRFNETFYENVRDMKED